MRLLALVSAALLVLAPGCASEPVPFAPPSRFEVIVAADAPMGVVRAAEDVADRLRDMGRDATLVPGAAGTPRDCAPGVGRVVLEGDALGEPDDVALPTDQTFAIRERRCDGGVLVALAGGGLLGRQYAAYEWLHAIGVRFFHPEETYVPPAPRWPDVPVERVHTPPLQWRSVSLHLTHPLELGDPWELGREDLYAEAVRYIDWTIANGASRGMGGIGSGELARYGIDRGFPTSSGLNLHSAQQGGRPLLDPDDPRCAVDRIRCEELQIAEAVDERMGTDPAAWPDFFGFTFNPSEFTEIPAEDAVRQITFLTSYITENYPGVRVETINHGTHGAPTSLGPRFYDLSQLAPPELGVRVHTLMFYDLFRPAPVYGNDDFGFLYDFMEREHGRRRITYFPEAAWWLTFDIAVPLYLPITLEARDRDLQGIAWMLQPAYDSDTGLVGHHAFGTGHEWGYWQNEYCSLRMSMDLEYRWQDCVRDIAAPMGEAGGEVASVIEALVALEERDFVTGWQDTLPFLVGTDPETEIAASVGIDFHPLPPTPPAILGWTEAEVAEWQERHLPALRRMDQEYGALVERLTAVSDDVPDDARSFFDEIRDGIEVTGLRARHAWQAYGAVVLARQASLTGDETRAEEAAALLAEAEATTADALAVIARRERSYRYLPLERSIAGGPNGDEDDNWTVYRYRYLARTHHAYYWARIDRLAAEALGGGGDAVRVQDAMLAPGARLLVEVLDPELAMPAIDYGDGTSATDATRFEHAYATSGIYALRLTATRGADPFELAGPVAQLVSEENVGFGGDVTSPAGVDLIEGVLPGLVLGALGDGRIAVGFSARRSGEVELGRWADATPRLGSTMALETEPRRLVVPIVNRGTASVSTEIVVDDAVVSRAGAGDPVVITGLLPTDAVVDAVVAIGGFEPVGARQIVASTLGYTPDTLPASVDFRVEYTTP